MGGTLISSRLVGRTPCAEALESCVFVFLLCAHIYGQRVRMVHDDWLYSSFGDASPRQPAVKELSKVLKKLLHRPGTLFTRSLFADYRNGVRGTVGFIGAIGLTG